MSETAKARVLVATCGGTISSKSTGRFATPALGADALVRDIPQLVDYAEVSGHTVMTKASPDVTLADVIELYDTLVAARPDVDGFVVTHGTDTLEEVAFTLDLLWDTDIPVVVTGAMRNADAVGADGAANLLAAVQTAAATDSAGQGVLVVLNDQIHSAQYVRKSHTANVATFQSPLLGPVGYLAEAVPRILLSNRHRHTIERPNPESLPVVPILTMGIGDDATVLDALAATNIGGLVIAGFGGGHVPDRVAQSAGLAALLERVPVVLTSRSGSGEPLSSTYTGFAGSETELLGRGLITAGRLDGPKAKVLLSLLVAAGRSAEQIVSTFLAIGKSG